MRLQDQRRRLQDLLVPIRLKKAEKELALLSPKLNKRELKGKEQIKKAVELTPIQKTILGLLDMDEDQYWGMATSEM